MIENTAQALGAANVSQPAQTRAVSVQEGLFSTTLEAAMAQGSEAQTDSAPAAAEGRNPFSLADFAPLLLSGLSQGSESGLLILLMAMIAGNNGSGLLGDLGGLDSASLLGSMGGSMGAGSGNALFGDTGGFGTGFGGSAASQAAMAAAQSLFKAYQGGSTGQGAVQPALAGWGAVSGSAVASGPAMESANAASNASPVGSDKAPGRTVTAELMSLPGNRSPALYRAVIDQFNVERNPRYAVNQKGTGDTYCNIFLWDVTAAMGAEIPHHTDRDTGAPAKRGEGNTLSMNANRISDWLNTLGPKYGWYEVTPEQAQALANRGSPAVTVWKNTGGGHGHVQVVSPSQDGAYDPGRGVAIAQAGRLLRNYTYITNIYSSRMKDVQYFAHK